MPSYRPPLPSAAMANNFRVSPNFTAQSSTIDGSAPQLASELGKMGLFLYVVTA